MGRGCSCPPRINPPGAWDGVIAFVKAIDALRVPGAEIRDEQGVGIVDLLAQGKDIKRLESQAFARQDMHAPQG